MILEIRAGTGGDEATCSRRRCCECTARYAERHGWKFRSTRCFGDRASAAFKEAMRIDRRRQGLFEAETRIGRASRAARAANRSQRTHSHFGDHRRGASRSEEVDVKIDPEEICASTRSVRLVPAASRSTLLTPRCASRTCRRTWLFRCRTRSRRSRIAKRRCASCVRGCRRLREQKQHDAIASERRLDGRLRRSLGKDSHLQLQRKSRHRSPHRPDDSPARSVMEGGLDPLIEARGYSLPG